LCSPSFDGGSRVAGVDDGVGSPANKVPHHRCGEAFVPSFPR